MLRYLQGKILRRTTNMVGNELVTELQEVGDVWGYLFYLPLREQIRNYATVGVVDATLIVTRSTVEIQNDDVLQFGSKKFEIVSRFKVDLKRVQERLELRRVE